MSQSPLTQYEALEGPLTPASPLWAWAYQGISERAESMLEHIGGVREGEDIEAVHDMRVWSRRLVAAMRVFAGCFPGKGYRRLLREARQVTRDLGGVRDLDVLIDHYRRLRSVDDPDTLLGIDYFVAIQDRLRRRARIPMLASLDEITNTDFVGRLRRFVRGEAEAYAAGLHPVVAGNGKHAAPVLDCRRSFSSAAPEFLLQRLDEFYSFEPYVHRPEAEEELHEMRIAAKWLRYTMELFAPAYAEGLKQPLGVTKRFQELLGDLHDSDVRRYILRDMLAAPLDARGLEAVGLMLPEPVHYSLDVLRVREEEVRRDLYAAFYKEWKKCERKEFRHRVLEVFQAPVIG